MADALEGWTDFNVAMVGATAALAGLLIVAMSVNIAEIMKSPTLPSRAGASVATLVLAIVVGALGLVPGQPTVAYGLEVLVGAVIATAFQLHAVLVVMREEPVSMTDRIAKSAVGVFPLVGFLVGGVLIAVGPASVGLIAVAFGSILAVIAAIIIAWVVLVEVLR